MKITLEATTKIVLLDGVPARVWEGVTQSGLPILCFITRLALSPPARSAEPALFARQLAQLKDELLEMRAPSADTALIPEALRL